MGDYELYHASNRKHKYIKKIGKRYFYTQEEIAAYLKAKKGDVTFEKETRLDYRNVGDDKKMKEYRVDFDKHYDKDGNRIWSHGVGVQIGNKKISVYNTTNKKYEKDPDVKGDDRGRFRREYAEDGATYSLDYSDKKTFLKRQRNELKQKKNNAEWLKSMGVDVSEHEARIKDDEAYLKRLEKKDAARGQTLKNLKKQASRGKKALERLNKKRAPKVEVIQSISEDKNYKRKNGGK